MAISIDGNNNTIGGLANGGLPDGCILDADINGMAASKLTGALPAISAASLTNIPSSEGTAKAWLKYEQTDNDVTGNTGNTGISDSFNISSVNDAGEGVTAVYWDTDFTNTHYAVVGLVSPGPNNDLNQIIHHCRNGGGVGTREAVQMTTGIGITTARVSDTEKQDAHFFIAAFGDQ